MLERYSNRNRQMIVMAQEETRLLRHNFVGTQHILLALLNPQIVEGIAGMVLTDHGLTSGQLRARIVELFPSGPKSRTRRFPYTPEARSSLLRAAEIAEERRDIELDTQHTLMGIIREDQRSTTDRTVAGRLLEEFLGDLHHLNQELIVLNEIAHGRAQFPDSDAFGLS